MKFIRFIIKNQKNLKLLCQINDLSKLKKLSILKYKLIKIKFLYISYLKINLNKFHRINRFHLTIFHKIYGI
jgi:hypothetical protein